MIAASFVLVANKEFIRLWVGELNYGGTLLNLVFVYWILQDTIYRSTTAFIYASGDLKNWSIASIFEAILNLVISFFLAKKIGIIGVALGTSISKTITTGISTPYFICIKLKIPFKNFILNGLFEPMLKSLPGIFLSWLISINIPKEFGWFWIIIFSLSIVILNILTFEGRVLFGKSNMSFKERINKIINFE
jgi:O-antigen/teichoic acid export membrane protein